MDDTLNRHLGKLPIVLCDCGEEILVISDLKAMIRCIQTHAKLHSQKETDPSKAKLEFNKIEEQLTQRVITAIANMSNHP